MKNYSIWNDIKNNEVCNSLNENINTDVLIIGGGITGISIAYHLINSNLKITLVEKNKIGMGTTSKTTGKITFLQQNLYSKICFYHNKEVAKEYYHSQIDAINIIKKTIQNENIECNFINSRSYIFDPKNSLKLKKEKAILKSFGASINEYEENKTEALCTDDAYVFHPLKYVNSLKQICINNKISIYENTSIESVKQNEDIYLCKSNGNKIIKTKYIVFALHYPYFLFPFLMPMKCLIEKSYIAAFKVGENKTYNAISLSKPTLSIRYHQKEKDSYLIKLIGSCYSTNDIKFKKFKYLINENPDYAWTNNDLITYDGLPFIGSINDNDTLFLATGYNTWGMTNSAIAGKVISDLILKQDNKYIKLFNPQRQFNLGKLVNYPLITGFNAYSFIKSKMCMSENIKYEKRDGKNVAIYIDENGKEHIVYNICPHLKCSLQFNFIEKTWDCPCHGSRFDIDGKCIEGPSNYNITY